jgi:hypothetical protein
MTQLYPDMTFAERRVAGYLNWLNIGWIYEQPVFVADNEGRPRLWTPDFYLPDFGMYVEVIGRPGVDYPYRRQVYANNNIPVLFVQVADDQHWMGNLISDICSIHEHRSELLGQILAPKLGRFEG